MILLQVGEKKKQRTMSTSQVLKSETSFLLRIGFVCALLLFFFFYFPILFCSDDPLRSRTHKAT